jgi:hypothetical protein
LNATIKRLVLAWTRIHRRSSPHHHPHRHAVRGNAAHPSLVLRGIGTSPPLLFFLPHRDLSATKSTTWPFLHTGSSPQVSIPPAVNVTGGLITRTGLTAVGKNEERSELDFGDQACSTDRRTKRFTGGFVAAVHSSMRRRSTNDRFTISPELTRRFTELY